MEQSEMVWFMWVPKRVTTFMGQTGFLNLLSREPNRQLWGHAEGTVTLGVACGCSAGVLLRELEPFSLLSPGRSGSYTNPTYHRPNTLVLKNVKSKCWFLVLFLVAVPPALPPTHPAVCACSSGRERQRGEGARSRGASGEDFLNYKNWHEKAMDIIQQLKRV